MRTSMLLIGGLALPLLAQPSLAQAPQYAVQDLGTFGGELANALGIDQAGHVVGQAEKPNFSPSPFVWADGVMTMIPGLMPSNDGRADGINELGHVVGSAMAPYPAGPGAVSHAFFWSRATGTIDLTPTATAISWAMAVNDAGQIVGGLGGPQGGARLWTIDGQGQVTATPIALPGAPAGFSNEATDVNQHGLVVGVGYNASFQYRAWKWNGSGSAVELSTLGGTQSIAEGVNDLGEICGTAQLPNNLHVPVKWLADGTIEQLPILPLPNLITTEARGINNHGHVVGAIVHVDPALGLPRSTPYVTIGGTSYDLNTLIPDNVLPEWDLRWAIDINDVGQIVGIANRIIDGVEYPGRAFLLTPEGSSATPYCFGDGSGTACPCGNAGGAGAGCASSSGNGGELAGNGSTSVASDDLAFSASGLPAGQSALLFAGTTAVNGGAGVAFGDGLRCAGGATVRLKVAFSSGGGVASFGAGHAAQGGYAPGDTRYFQVWYRDAFASVCGAGFNLTQGLEVAFTP